LEKIVLEKALIVCTPGLEKELRRELQEVWPYLLSPQGIPQAEPFPEVDMVKGGLEIPCDFFRAVQLNFFLHLATRVLWRISEFRSRDFPKLYQNLKKIPWNQWLTSSKVEWHVAAAKSRLNNEKRIVEVAKEVFSEAKIPEKTHSHDIYIRFYDDVGTVSLDLSGEPLYKRILSKQTGEAPFRETWANFVLRRMMKNVSLAEIQNLNLVDPFCGSGTFLFEALFFNFPNFHREFAFQNLLRAPKLFKSPTFSRNYKWPQNILFKSVIGSDKDAKMIEVSHHNLKAYQQHFQTTSPPIELVHRSFSEYIEDLKANTIPEKERRTWVVCNPPWGKRLGQSESFEGLIKTLAANWKPQKLAVVLPAQSINPSCISSHYEVQENTSLKLGGTDVSLTIWHCKDEAF
jgi:putative N6-adenine-specific DNA methylase